MALLALYLTLLLPYLHHHLIKPWLSGKDFSVWPSIYIHFLFIGNLTHAGHCPSPWRLRSKWNRQHSSLKEAHWREKSKCIHTLMSLLGRRRRKYGEGQRVMRLWVCGCASVVVHVYECECVNVYACVKYVWVSRTQMERQIDFEQHGPRRYPSEKGIWTPLKGMSKKSCEYLGIQSIDKRKSK